MAKFSRRQVARAIADKLLSGETSKKALSELAAYLVVHKQLRQADLYMADIEAQLADQGYVIADVTSAHALDDELRSQIKQLIGGDAKTVAFREQIDSDLIGGIVVSTRGRLIDTSLKARLQQLRTRA